MDMIKIVSNSRESLGEIVSKAKAAQLAVAAEAFADCSKYCKVDTGRLRDSGGVDPVTGIMTWETEYARIAYYTGDPDRSKNPQASLMWAHKAASVHGEKWKSTVERIML